MERTLWVVVCSVIGRIDNVLDALIHMMCIALGIWKMMILQGFGHVDADLTSLQVVYGPRRCWTSVTDSLEPDILREEGIGCKVGFYLEVGCCSWKKGLAIFYISSPQDR